MLTLLIFPVCVVVLSNADMFDKTLPCYISEHDPELKKGTDCVDLCTKHYMTKVSDVVK